MYEIRKVTTKDWELVDDIFADFYTVNSVISFKRIGWKVRTLENLYMIENDKLLPFLNLLRYTGSLGLTLIPIMHKKDFLEKNLIKYNCIDFSKIPTSETFLSVADEYHFSYTGGIIISKCNRIAGFSDVDNSILYLGFDSDLEDEVLKKFSNFLFD